MSRLRRNVKALTIEKKKPRDYDPEDDRADDGDDSGTGSEEEDTTGGREHYEAVGKSKLRAPEEAPLDAKYAAAAVSRAALAGEESEDNDPLAPQDDDDEDEDPFAVASDLKKDSLDSDSEEGEVEEEDEDTESDGEEESMNGLDVSDGNEESDEAMEDAESREEEDDTEDEAAAPRLLNSITASKGREELKAQIKASQHLAAGLSKAATNDAKKGQAVRKQYQTFDRLLDARMKLQKGLIASDDLPFQRDQNAFTSDADDALQKAQDAALRLFNTIGSFRDSLANAAISDPSSKKRKRPATFESADDLDSLWTSLTELEAESLPPRQTTIDRWSAKAKLSDPSRGTTNSKAKFLDSSVHDDRLTTVLEAFISSEQEKFFRNQSGEEQKDADPALGQRIPVYDDSIFYQSLLRDLIKARSAASTDISTSILPPKLHASGNRRNKKTIDTKASKGRKIRYTVHEKLQNFMASEGDTGRDTAMWTERGKNEFFGSLFGQDRVLGEDDEDEDMVEGEDANDDGAEVEALRLFRT